jgi:LL-diaminopimelate aminotransferase
VKFANRISQLPPYVFATMAQRIAARRAQGDHVINFGMGDPDIPMPDFLIEALCDAAHDPATHRYPSYFGLPALREAITEWYRRRFDVPLDPTAEVLPLIGSKEGIANIALAFCDPGEIALVPDPGYPVYRYGAVMADGQVYPVTLRAERGCLPDLEAIPQEVREQANLLWLNYPNNPTGATADLAFFEEVVTFARRYDIIICHDNPYSEIGYDGYRAPSILQVPGAREVAVEFNSLSKTYNMAGARIGMVVGNAQVVEALSRIKSNIDSGLPTMLQRTAVAALTGDQAWIAERNLVYQRRRDLLCRALCDAGIVAPPPRASLYIWGTVPAGMTSAAFADHLFEQLAVVVTPGTSFGACGEGYFRLSVTVPDAEVEMAAERLATLRF